MNQTFTAVYSKNENIVVDISIRLDHDKISKINDFINLISDEYEINEEGGILTILIYLDPIRSEESSSIINSFYGFIE
jgi:hypothetical protein